MDRHERTSTPVKESEVPQGLSWIKEEPREEYMVKIDLAPIAEGAYRRVTFRDGTKIYALLRYKERTARG